MPRKSIREKFDLENEATLLLKKSNEVVTRIAKGLPKNEAAKKEKEKEATRKGKEEVEEEANKRIEICKVEEMFREISESIKEVIRNKVSALEGEIAKLKGRVEFLIEQNEKTQSDMEEIKEMIGR